MAEQPFDAHLLAKNSVAVGGDSNPITESLQPFRLGSPKIAAGASTVETATPMPQSYLEKGIDCVTAPLIKDVGLRKTVDHYATQFAQTASLFTGGKIGIAATLITYGLGQAAPGMDLRDQAEDFALGATKGVAMRGLFKGVGNHIALAPLKGVALGVGSRALDVVLNRQSLDDPSKAFTTLEKQTLDPTMWKYDAVVWTLGEGMMGVANATTGNALNRSAFGSSLLAGGTFGAVSGGASEIVKEKASGESIDWGKVAEKGALEAGINGLAAGLGGAVTMRMSDSSVSLTQSQVAASRKVMRAELLRHMMRITAPDAISPIPDDAVGPPQREFVVTDGREALAKFQSEKSTNSVSLKVRELIRNADGQEQLGEQKSLFVQELAGKNDARLLAGAQAADLVASCHPEKLTEAERANHVFPEAKGHVWVISGDGDRILLSAGEQPMVKLSQMNDYKTATRLDFGDSTLNAMAPLIVGDPHDLKSEYSKAQFAEFDRQLVEAKKLGMDAISTDVWWGLIEPSKGQFDWSYYDKISDHIIAAGLKWVPIISLHQCGGNVGDDFTSKLPDWVWEDMAAKTGRPVEDFKYKSEQGHTSSEYISLFKDDVAQEYYANVMRSFRDHFADKAKHVQEVNISLGAAGELRYPSYNSHDQNAGYPTRGALQMYSQPAIQSLRSDVLAKYTGLEGLRKAWSRPDLETEHILPPDDPTGMFARGDHFNTQYGRDLFDWYNQKLIDHGRDTLRTALSVFGEKGSAWGDVDIGAKIAGVHWRIGSVENGVVILSDRLAELCAGLIRTSAHDWDSDADGRGYRPLMSMLHDVQPVRVDGHGNRIVPFFTCVEISDGDNGPQVKSLAHTLASWFGLEAQHQGLFVKAENALAGDLQNPTDWHNIDALMAGTTGGTGYYHGTTFLRLQDIVNNNMARDEFVKLRQQVDSIKQKRAESTTTNANDNSAAATAGAGAAAK